MKRVAALILVAGFGVLLALTLVEAALHLADIAPLHELRYQPYYVNQSHEIVGWLYVPNIEFSYKTAFRNFNTRVRTNSKGLREREYSYHKRDRTFRILILGDSLAASFEVPPEDTWHELLENMMNARAGTRTTVEVITASAQGWSTDQQLLYYLHEGEKYRPDLVVLQFYVNDIYSNDTSLAPRERLQQQKPFFVLGSDRLVLKNFPFRGDGLWFDTGYPQTLGWRIRSILLRNSRTLRLVRTARLRRRIPSHWSCYGNPGGVPLELMVYARVYPAEVAAAWKLTASLVRQLHAEVTKRGQRFAVVYVPERRQVRREDWQEALNCWPQAAAVQWDLDKPNRFLGSFLEGSGVPYLDLTPHFREYAANTGRALYFSQDWHLDPEGHRLAARVLHNWLKGTGPMSP